VRGLGPWSSAAIVVGTMIGTGIFLKPAEMAADAG
jgi:amino acid permease